MGARNVEAFASDSDDDIKGIFGDTNDVSAKPEEVVQDPAPAEFRNDETRNELSQHQRPPVGKVREGLQMYHCCVTDCLLRFPSPCSFAIAEESSAYWEALQGLVRLLSARPHP